MRLERSPCLCVSPRASRSREFVTCSHAWANRSLKSHDRRSEFGCAVLAQGSVWTPSRATTPTDTEWQTERDFFFRNAADNGLGELLVDLLFYPHISPSLFRFSDPTLDSRTTGKGFWRLRCKKQKNSVAKVFLKNGRSQWNCRQHHDLKCPPRFWQTGTRTISQRSKRSNGFLSIRVCLTFDLLQECSLWYDSMWHISILEISISEGKLVIQWWGVCKLCK